MMGLRARIGYLIPEFPTQTHAFFWREIQALEKLRCEVFLASTRRPSAECRHSFAGPARKRTRYLFPPRLLSVLLTALARPVQTAKSIRYVLGLTETSLVRRFSYIGLVAAAAELYRHARITKMQHVHIHSCATAAHVGAICSLLGGPPYSLTLHGDLPVYGVDHRQKMARAEFVAVVTKDLQRQVVEQVGLSADRVPVIWMGVDTNRFVDNASPRSPAGSLRITTVARLHPAKGHIHALAAVRVAIDRGCDVHYTIAGEGPQRNAIEREIARLQLGERVQLVGTLSEEEVLQLLQSSDVFVLPSVGKGEAAPVSVMEAMSCGLPVVCSIIGGTPDMITDRIDGILVEKGDEEGLADALIRLATNPDDRRRLGDAARRRAVSTFDVRVTASRLLDAMKLKNGWVSTARNSQ